MKQLGNLAIVCAQRKDIRLEISLGRAILHVIDYTPNVVACDDDAAINELIRELNFGRYSEEYIKLKRRIVEAIQPNMPLLCSTEAAKKVVMVAYVRDLPSEDKIAVDRLAKEWTVTTAEAILEIIGYVRMVGTD